MSWAREGLPRICCFLFALWGRKVCYLLGKMRIKRCVLSACERQRKAMGAEVLNSGPRGTGGPGGDPVAGCGLGEMPDAQGRPTLPMRAK